MRERDRRLVAGITSFIGFLVIANSAFTKKNKKKVGERDRWHCQDEGCEKSFQNGWMVHASHYNHSREIPGYDNPSAGRIQCVEHHLEYHEAHIGLAHLIGLCEEANLHAINMLRGTEQKKLKRWGS